MATTYYVSGGQTPIVGRRLKTKTLNVRGYTVAPSSNVILNYNTGPGNLSGIINVNGEIIQGAIVLCLEELTDAYVKSTVTDVNGAFSFNGLNTDKKYYLVVKEPTGLWEYRVSSRREPMHQDPDYVNTLFHTGSNFKLDSNELIDYSRFHRTITRSTMGFGTFKVSDESKIFQHSSIKCDGSGWISVDIPDTITTFTAEMFVNFRSLSLQAFMIQYGFGTVAQSDGSIQLVAPNGVDVLTTHAGYVVPGVWYHVAVTRNTSNRMDLWINGVRAGEGFIDSTPFPSIDSSEWGFGDNCFVDEIRIKNHCIYTENFLRPQFRLPRS